MEMDLSARVREVLEAGGGEPAPGGRFLPLVLLESGARIGLDAAAGWILVPAEGSPRAYSPEQGQVFFEALESKRDDFDGRLEEAARTILMEVAETVGAEYGALHVHDASPGEHLPVGLGTSPPTWSTRCAPRPRAWDSPPRRSASACARSAWT